MTDILDDLAKSFASYAAPDGDRDHAALLGAAGQEIIRLRARVTELLASNNQFEERARVAERRATAAESIVHQAIYQVLAEVAKAPSVIKTDSYGRAYAEPTNIRTELARLSAINEPTAALRAAAEESIRAGLAILCAAGQAPPPDGGPL